MIFFKIVGISLFTVLVMNLIQVSVEMNIRGGVYACSEVTTYDPIDVKRKCRRNV
jgi:hypothetical protein